jgi:hypothetical protein
MPDETSARPDRYELLDSTVELDRCALLRGQEEVRLRGRSFDVLTYLVGHAKRVVGKQELMDAVLGLGFVLLTRRRPFDPGRRAGRPAHPHRPARGRRSAAEACRVDDVRRRRVSQLEGRQAGWHQPLVGPVGLPPGG